MRKYLAPALVLLSLISFVTHVFAEQGFVQRKDVREFILEMVNKHGFNREALTKTLSGVQLQPAIIESMEKPYEKKTWDVYQQIFLTEERYQGGIAFWNENRKTLARAQKEFGVPASIIVAIIGVETRYGKHQGNYRVLDALSTLAFNYPARAPFFRKELAEFLILCREQGNNPDEYLGSYAGAIGKPQFMPSSYRAFAIDYSGTGKRDLRNDNEDVIASIANYLHQHGWKPDEAITQPARVRGSAWKRIATNSRTAEYPMRELERLGIRPVPPPRSHPDKAGLIVLTTNTGEAFWIAYPNFYVITRYNTSPQYALAVFLLASKLENAQPRDNGHPHVS